MSNKEKSFRETMDDVVAATEKEVKALDLLLTSDIPQSSKIRNALIELKSILEFTLEICNSTKNHNETKSN